MIIDLLIALLVVLLNAVFAALPVWQITPQTQQIAEVLHVVRLYDSILPVSEAFVTMSLFVTIFIAMNALKWGKALYNAVRGSGA